MGRPPKPTSLKKTQGTYRDDRAPENEPMPDVPDDVPSPPDWFPEDAKAFWAVYAPMFHRAGLLTEVDVLFFGSGALVYTFMVQAARDLQNEGIRVESARKDSDRVKNPSFQIFRDSYGMFAKWCSAFGATPADRTKISVEKKPDAKKGILRLVS